MIAIISKIIALAIFIAIDIQDSQALLITLYFLFYVVTAIWPASYMLWVHHRTFKREEEYSRLTLSNANSPEQA